MPSFYYNIYLAIINYFISFNYKVWSGLYYIFTKLYLHTPLHLLTYYNIIIAIYAVTLEVQNIEHAEWSIITVHTNTAIYLSNINYVTPLQLPLLCIQLYHNQDER